MFALYLRYIICATVLHASIKHELHLYLCGSHLDFCAAADRSVAPPARIGAPHGQSKRLEHVSLVQVNLKHTCICVSCALGSFSCR